MNAVTVYSKDWCPYCKAAKQLLNQKGIDFDEIDITNDLAREGEMRKRTGRTSVPQIYVGDVHVGGFDDLTHSSRTGELALLLESESAQIAS